jgi:formate hydrogenlyase subunit 6/NADH:ubiquinone oxidoreductase subunit I
MIMRLYLPTMISRSIVTKSNEISHCGCKVTKILLTFILFFYLCGMIFYFSGTGNTLWAAEQLAQITGESLISIADAMHMHQFEYTLQPDERIGFCFPVHGWQPPMIVRRFIRHLLIDKVEGHFCYAVCTCGDTVAKAINILQKELGRKGLHAESCFSLIMPESYVALPLMDVDTKSNELRKKKEAADKLPDIAQLIINRKRDVNQLTEGPIPYFFTYVIGHFFNRHMISDKPFRVDEDSCMKCGRCAHACPVGDIIGIKGEIPVWKHEPDLCTMCMTCYHHCPQHAIQYGRRTKNKGQYFFNRK